jgi:hypothetical protein
METPGIASPSSSGRHLQLFPSGFHGDEHLQSLVAAVASRSSSFVETGTNVGSTLHWVSRTWPTLQAYSCEPEREPYEVAVQHLTDYPRAEVFNETSQAFISRFLPGGHLEHVRDGTVCFWLDAHGWGFEWPLREEVAWVCSCFSRFFMFVDDCRVVDHPEFTFDSYGEQVCEFDYFKDVLAPGDYLVYTPDYVDRTSGHHPLVGWVMVTPRALGLPPLSPTDAARFKVTPFTVGRGAMR